MNECAMPKPRQPSWQPSQAPLSAALGTLGHCVWTQALTSHVGSG